MKITKRETIKEQWKHRRGKTVSEHCRVVTTVNLHTTQSIHNYHGSYLLVAKVTLELAGRGQSVSDNKSVKVSLSHFSISSL